MKLAEDLASGVSLKRISVKHKIDYGYLRKISAGERVRDVRKLADAMVDENVLTAKLLAKKQAKAAVETLVCMQENLRDPETGKTPYREDTQRGAANDIIALAYRDVADANTSHSHIHIEGGIVILADVIGKQSAMPAERRVALGLDQLAAIAPSNGNGHSGNGHHGGNGHGASQHNRDGN